MGIFFLVFKLGMLVLGTFVMGIGALLGGLFTSTTLNKAGGLGSYLTMWKRRGDASSWSETTPLSPGHDEDKQ